MRAWAEQPGTLPQAVHDSRTASSPSAAPRPAVRPGRTPVPKAESLSSGRWGPAVIAACSAGLQRRSGRRHWLPRGRLGLSRGRRNAQRPASVVEVSAPGTRLKELVPRSSTVCIVPQAELRYLGVADDPTELYWDLFKNTAIFVLPFAGPAVAFINWETILWLNRLVLGEEGELLRLTQYTLTPATNGIVVSCMASALGTLTSITAASLRQRQLDLRNTINREACECQLLITRLATAAPLAQDDEGREGLVVHIQMLALVRQYVARVAAESNKGVDISQLEASGASNSELRGVMRTSRECYLSEAFRADVVLSVAKLHDARSLRLAQLTTSFPFIHWVILAVLAASIAVCFLIEVDQYEGRFIAENPKDSLRLRVIFSLLVGTFSGLSALCADLNDPFRGGFNISGATKQLFSILAGVDQELEELLVELNPMLSRGDLERQFKKEMRKKKDASEVDTVDFDGVLNWLRSNAKG